MGLPELPEVETVARGLRARIVGGRITDVEVFDSRLGGLHGAGSPAGRTVTGVRRRGKYLAIELAPSGILLLHMMMSGRILVRRAGDEPDPYLRLRLRLDGGIELRFCDPRRFGTARLLDRRQWRVFLRGMGPEPMSAGFTAAKLSQRIAGRKAPIKAVLLDQGTLAGVGNIYADEALWRARIHPAKRAGDLSGRETAALHRGIRKVLRQAIEARGTTFSRFADAEGYSGENQANLKVFRRTGLPCLRCGTPIERTIVAGRSNHFCPRCQAQEGSSGGASGATRRVRSPR